MKLFLILFSSIFLGIVLGIPVMWELWKWASLNLY